MVCDLRRRVEEASAGRLNAQSSMLAAWWKASICGSGSVSVCEGMTSMSEWLLLSTYL